MAIPCLFVLFSNCKLAVRFRLVTNSNISFCRQKKSNVVVFCRSFRDTLGKYICAFLNTEDGAIYYGVSATGRVIGFEVSQAFQDKLTLEIDKVIEFTEPDVPVSAYHINFVKIINAAGNVEPRLVVLEIKVRGLVPVGQKYAFNGTAYFWAGDNFQIFGRKQSNTAGDSRPDNTGSFDNKQDNKGGSSQDTRGGSSQDNRDGSNQDNRGGSKQDNRGGSSQGNRGGSRDEARQNSIVSNTGGNLKGNRDDNSRTDKDGNEGGRGGSKGNRSGSNGNWCGSRQDYRGDHRYGYYDYTSDSFL